ncbi:MAG TPA: DNA topoisomerase IB [Chthoniobacteraceae bacterium]|nr:DNA topoisomerase IB [Chthoniobacteraceae bacterium]
MPKHSPAVREASGKLNEALTQEAHEARLQYFNDDRAGFRRKLRGKQFVYFSESGKRISDRNVLARIKRLAIPPAWKDVWICPSANGHLQASGRDARGRKQYRYHDRWRAQRDETKFHRVLAFARALPRIRRRVKRDIGLAGMPREKILATVVRLLEFSLIRVGNEEYARDNKSYGLTTMKNHHAKISRDRIRFTFRGKSGKQHEISVRDRTLAAIVKHCQDLPGQKLFEYEDENHEPRSLDSHDVNEYIRAVAGDDFTAKDFRTWAGTVLAAVALREFREVSGRNEAKRNVVTAIEAVAKMLGNTPSVCRKCYIHPGVLDSYLEGRTIDTLQGRMKAKIGRGLYNFKPEEAAVLVLLKSGLKKR